MPTFETDHLVAWDTASDKVLTKIDPWFVGAATNRWIPSVAAEFYLRGNNAVNFRGSNNFSGGGGGGDTGALMVRGLDRSTYIGLKPSLYKNAGKFDEYNNKIWAIETAREDHSGGYLNAIVPNEMDTAVYTGHPGHLTRLNANLLKIDAETGEILWGENIGPDETVECICKTRDGSGDMIIGLSANGDPSIFRITPTGGIRWSANIITQPTRLQNSMAIDDLGRLLIGAYFTQAPGCYNNLRVLDAWTGNLITTVEWENAKAWSGWPVDDWHYADVISIIIVPDGSNYSIIADAFGWVRLCDENFNSIWELVGGSQSPPAGIHFVDGCEYAWVIPVCLSGANIRKIRMSDGEVMETVVTQVDFYHEIFSGPNWQPEKIITAFGGAEGSGISREYGSGPFIDFRIRARHIPNIGEASNNPQPGEYVQDHCYDYPYSQDYGVVKFHTAISTNWSIEASDVSPAYAERVSYAHSRPFYNWNGQGPGYSDYWEIGHKVYYNVTGLFYRCISTCYGQYQAPDSAEYGVGGSITPCWEEIPAPSPRFDSYPPWGGAGELEDPPGVPRYYTAAFHGMIDPAFDGVYHLYKAIGSFDGLWRFRCFDPDGGNIEVLFRLCYGNLDAEETIIEFNYSPPSTGLWSEYVFYPAGDVCEHDGKFYRAALASGLDGAAVEPPNATYWTPFVRRWLVPIEAFKYSNADNYGVSYYLRAITPDTGQSTSAIVSVYPGDIPEWDPAGSYAIDDIVAWHGYIYRKATTAENIEPPDPSWQIVPLAV